MLEYCSLYLKAGTTENPSEMRGDKARSDRVTETVKLCNSETSNQFPVSSFQFPDSRFLIALFKKTYLLWIVF